jgi:polar amino acid transport system permease protein
VVIGAFELMTQAQLIASSTFRAFEVYSVIAAIYFALCFPLSQGLLWFERQIRAGVALSPRRRRRLQRARLLLSEGLPS